MNNPQLIINLSLLIVILICLYKFLFDNPKQIYLLYGMLSSITISFYNLLISPSVPQVFSIIIQVIILCYCLFIHVKRSLEKIDNE